MVEATKKDKLCGGQARYFGQIHNYFEITTLLFKFKKIRIYLEYVHFLPLNSFKFLALLT